MDEITTNNKDTRFKLDLAQKIPISLIAITLDKNLHKLDQIKDQLQPEDDDNKEHELNANLTTENVIGDPTSNSNHTSQKSGNRSPIAIGKIKQAFVFQSQISTSIQNSGDKTPNVMDENLMYQNTNFVCNVIIDSFIDLYEKYIKESCEYQINIQSRLKKDLLLMLDKQHFERVKPATPTGKHDQNAGIHKRLDDYRNQTDGNVVPVESGEFHQHSPRVESTVYHTYVIEWLLINLMRTMEQAVREVALLMNDSYSRFRKNEKLLDACIQAAKNAKNI